MTASLSWSFCVEPTLLVNGALPAASSRNDTATAAPQATLQAHWAQDPALIEAAQALRYRVFAQEMGAQMPEVRSRSGQRLDVDRFDAFCEHLVITQTRGAYQEPEVIGTYRVLLPDAARRAGGYYTETEFDCTSLQIDRSLMAELGRSCVAAEHRTGPVIQKLWAALFQFLLANQVRYVIGCTSVSLADGGAHAARLWASLRQQAMAPEALHVCPRVPLPIERLEAAGTVEIPTLVRGYLKCGAQLMGPPAWDPDFAVADLPMVLDMERLSPSFRRRLLTA